MKSLMIFSACYGAYDDIPTIPANLTPLTVMYTDDHDVADLALLRGWGEARVVNHGIATHSGASVLTGPMLAHKWWKMFAGFDECEVSVWLDASMTITAPDFVDRCWQAIGWEVCPVDLTLMAHPWRSCIFEEAEYSASLVRYESLSWELRRQADYYSSIGHPRDDGLYATGFYIRRNNDHVRKLMQDWWWENIMRTHQDQVSLPVVLRLHPEVSYDVCLPWHDGPYSWTSLGFHLK